MLTKEKHIPVMGPGSKICALVPQLKRFIMVRTYLIERKQEPGADICFNTVLWKKWPKEMTSNEEIGWIARRLEAPNNLLTEIPNKISVMSRLQVLDLRHNYISKVPNSVCKFKELTYLNLSENRIKALPKSLNKPPLIKLEAQSNRIKKIPNGLGNSKTLEFVDLSNNLIRKVPKNMYKRPMILKADHNRIKTLASMKVWRVL